MLRLLKAKVGLLVGVAGRPFNANISHKFRILSRTTSTFDYLLVTLQLLRLGGALANMLTTPSPANVSQLARIRNISYALQICDMNYN